MSLKLVYSLERMDCSFFQFLSSGILLRVSHSGIKLVLSRSFLTHKIQDVLTSWVCQSKFWVELYAYHMPRHVITFIEGQVQLEVDDQIY